jgi:pimeloyl-ACP methyl ester carboxylesterase
MKAVITVVLMVIVIPVVALTVLPLSRYASSQREKLEMNDTARWDVTGSFVRITDGVTHYQIGGPASATTLLLIPGFSTTFSVWDPTYDGLTAAGVRVLRYDLFGRGWSDRPVARYDADFYDRQIVDLLNALAISGPVDVAGVSMGGPIVATFVVRHPERVRHVLLFDPGYWPENPAPFKFRAPGLGEFNMNVSMAPRLPESQWQDFVHPERYPHYLDAYRAQMRYHGFRRALLETIRNYLSKDVTADFKRLGKSSKPVLLIWGKEDKDVPIVIADQVRADIPQAEFHPIDDAAHIPHYERPDVVNPIVLEFLRRNSAPVPASK